MLIGIAVGYSYTNTGFKAPWFATEDGSFNTSDFSASETDPYWSANMTAGYAKIALNGIPSIASDGDNVFYTNDSDGFPKVTFAQSNGYPFLRIITTNNGLYDLQQDVSPQSDEWKSILRNNTLLCSGGNITCTYNANGSVTLNASGTGSGGGSAGANGSYSYYIYNQSGTYYAVDSAGGVAYSGTNAWTVLDSAFTAGAKVIYLKTGTNITNIPLNEWGQTGLGTRFPVDTTVIGEDWNTNVIGVVDPSTNFFVGNGGTTLINVGILSAFNDDPDHPAGTVKRIKYWTNARRDNVAEIVTNWDAMPYMSIFGEPGEDAPGFALLNYGMGDSIYLGMHDNKSGSTGGATGIRIWDYSSYYNNPYIANIKIDDMNASAQAAGKRSYINITDRGLTSYFDVSDHGVLAPTFQATNVYTDTLRSNNAAGIAVGTNLGNASVFFSNNPDDAITIYRRIVPSVNNTYDLGYASGMFKDIYAKRFIGDGSLLTGITGSVASVSGTAPVVSSGGNTPAISMAAASSGVNGYMTGTYATKLDGIAAGAQPGTVTGVTATAPVVSSGGTTPAISMAAATGSVNGYATSTQITKLNGIEAGATADQSDTEIVAAIADKTIAPATSSQTNVYTQTLRVKDSVAGITVGENGGTAIMYFDNTPGQGTISYKHFVPSGNGTLGLGWSGGRWADIWGQNIHTGDLIFSEKTDYNTGVPFKIGDTVKLIVIGFDESGGIRTVPVLDN